MSATHLKNASIVSAVTSSAGPWRSINEDAFGSNIRTGVFVVADGTGGLGSGRDAADIVITTMTEAPPDNGSPSHTAAHEQMDALAASVLLANERLAEAATGERHGMGATMAAIRVRLPWVTVVHVGDCRVYRYRRGDHAGQVHADEQGGRLRPLTIDHSLGGDTLRQGGSLDRAKDLYGTNVTCVTRALGVGLLPAVDLQYHLAMPGDIYLLCSDGLTSHLDLATLDVLVGNDQIDIRTRTQQLVDAAAQHLSRDNITAMLVQIVH